MSELLHLLVVVIVICVLVWLASQAPLPENLAPVRWVLYALIVVIALVALLPFLGLHMA